MDKSMENLSRESCPKEYQTKDLYLSAYLKSKGLRLTNTIKEGRTLLFVFEDNAKREGLIQQFFYNEVGDNCNMASLLKEIQALKSLIYDGGGR